MELSYINGSYEKYEDSDNDKLRFLYKYYIEKNNYSNNYRDLINELFTDNVNESTIIKYLLNSFYKIIQKK